MEEKDYDSFADAMERLAERRPKQLTERLIDAYFNSLKRFPVHTVLDLLNRWPEQSMRKGFPLEIELIECLKKIVPKRSVDNGEKGDLHRQIGELRQKHHLLIMQLLSKGICIDILCKFPNLGKFVETNQGLMKYLCMDYSMYSNSLTKEDLYKQQDEIYKKILWLEFLLINPNGENLK